MIRMLDRSYITLPTGLRLRIRMLGGFDVMVGAQVVPSVAWRQRRAASIIQMLALAPNHRMHREHLMEAFWPTLDLPDQANNLRQTLHHARKAIESAGMPRGTVLTRDGESVVLASSAAIEPDIWVDVLAFQRAVDAAWSALTPSTAQAALALYAGDLLPNDPFDAWVEDLRTGLRASYLALLTRLGQLYAERGQPTEAIGVFHRLIASEPTLESAYVALMRLHATLDQRDIALAQYDRLVLALARDDLEPEPATRAVADALRDRSERMPDAGSATIPDVSANAARTICLPHPRDRTIGREREIAEIRQLLSTARLVTLTGPGGIGKTRLALEVATAASADARIEVAFVDLTPVRDPRLVLNSIAHALDVREPSDRAALSAIRLRCGGRRTLLVIDNFEHLVATAAVVSDLLSALPLLEILVTSRVRLRVPAEREYVVGPLSVATPLAGDLAHMTSPAAALFELRAREVRPEFSLTSANAATVAAICARLDGLPLAIELGAARIRLLTPEAIMQRLERPLSLLTGGTADRPERQQTMRRAIQWSVDLLSPEEQLLLRQLSVFQGGWTIDAAEAVAMLPDTDFADLTVLDGLTSLVDKHLITQRDSRPGDVRFGMLETIREFGVEQLEARGDSAATRDRHARWYVRLAERAAPHLEQSDQGLWLEHLDAEDDNLRAALAWITEREQVDLGLRLVYALRLHWFMRGRLIEGCDWTLRIADLPGADDQPALNADVLIGAGFFAREYGDYDRAYTASRRALSLTHRIGDRKRAADAMVNLGFVALQRGDYLDARSLFTRVLSTYREIDHPQGIADAVSLLGLTMGCLGDDESAYTLIAESVAIWEALDDRQALIMARSWLGSVFTRQRRFGDACSEFSRALEFAKELGFEWGMSIPFDGFAQIAIEIDLPRFALDLLVAASRVRAVSGVRPWPIDERAVQRTLEQLRAVLGPDVVERAFAERDAPALDHLAAEIRSVFQFLLDSALAAGD